MENIISLGCGYYDLETSPTFFRWTGEVFSIYFEQNVLELELLIGCNKVVSEYNLSYSIDNWKTSETILLENGESIVHVDLKNPKKIDFKSSTFVPSNGDERKLGIQIFKVFCKTEDQKYHEITIDTIKFKKELVVTRRINKNSFCVTLKDGWHELEKDYFRWSNGCGRLSLTDFKFDNIRLLVSPPHNTTLKVLVDDKEPKVFDLKEGEQEVILNQLRGCKEVSLITDIFKPISKNELNKDERELGIQLCSIELYNDDDNETDTLFVKNLFFESDTDTLLEFSQFNFSDTEYSEINSNGHVVLTKFPETFNGKFNINNQIVFYTHRSGWSYAIESIKSLHNENGVIFDGFLEKTFSWDKYKNIKESKIPRKQPWVGVIHNPMTNLFEREDGFSTNKLLKSIVFMKSLESCKGLYVLSNDLKTKLQSKIQNAPIEFLYHPTKTPEQTFSWERFIANENRGIVSIGTWLRRYISIYLLKSDDSICKKYTISQLTLNEEKLKSYIQLEQSLENVEVSEKDFVSVQKLPHQNSSNYDNLLSENITFMDFYDISASNLIIESIVRNTPILVRKHQAVVDYLGETYPLYFDSLEEASVKLKNVELIKSAYEYLIDLPTKGHLTGDYFKKSIMEGKIYNNL